MPESNYADVEVVSPGGKKANTPPEENRDPLFALIAKLMDNFFHIPGTNIKFGLDPVIGLIPGIGDSSGAIISSLLILRGAKAGLARVVLVRMAMNVLLNTLVGAIPVIGDVFSVWFKSNQLNYELYQKHLGTEVPSQKKDWAFVIGLLVILLLAIAFIIIFSLMLFAALWKFLSS